MRTITTLGVALVIGGALVIAASSGAFSLTSVDRGVGVETAIDEDALLGVNYEDRDDRLLELESENSDGGGECYIISCNEYEYNDEEIVVFEDNSASGDLEIVNITTESNNEDLIPEENLQTDTDQGIGVIRGDFRCPSYGIWGSGDQGDDSATVTIAVVASDGDLIINLERTVSIQCVAD